MKSESSLQGRLFMYANNGAGTPDAAYLTNVNIVDNTINASKLTDLTITTVKIADNNITTAKILNSSITLGKLANGTANQVILYNTSGVPINGKVDWLLTGAAKTAAFFAYH